MTAPPNMHNLTTLIKRLEAATSRLEDIATSTEPPNEATPSSDPTASPPDVTNSINAATGHKTCDASEGVPESVEEFDLLLSSSVEKYVQLSDQLGGIVSQQASAVLKGFQEQRKLLLISTRAIKPELSVFENLLKPINEAVITVNQLKEANRTDPMHTQLSAVADGIMMLAWVTVDNRPHRHVDECLDSAQFFGNRVLKEFKDKEAKQAEWVHSFYQIFRDLSTYLRQYFPSGISWNPEGEPASDVAQSLSTSTASVGSSIAPPPPPPPPPGPAPFLDISTSPAGASGSSKGFGAVFPELNQGTAVTKNLRKVDRSEMTHKNPALRAGSVVTDKDASVRAKSPAPGKKPKPESMRVKKTPKELNGNKWTIENYDGESQPVEIEASLSQSILVSRCNKTTVVVKGKANQITVENSSRLSLVIDTLVSTVDVIKARDFAMQVLGTIPTILFDQVDGAQIYLSKKSTGAKLFTSKSNGINLNIVSGPDDDFKEVPLPSQICSYYDENKGDLVSEIVAFNG